MESAYTSSGVYTWVGTNIDNCDSTVTLNLTVNYSNTSSETTTACDSYLWNGTTYDISKGLIQFLQIVLDVIVP